MNMPVVLLISATRLDQAAFWSRQSSDGAINPSSAAALGLETSFQLDLNGDGLLG